MNFLPNCGRAHAENSRNSEVLGSSFSNTCFGSPRECCCRIFDVGKFDWFDRYLKFEGWTFGCGIDSALEAKQKLWEVINSCNQKHEIQQSLQKVDQRTSRSIFSTCNDVQWSSMETHLQLYSTTKRIKSIRDSPLNNYDCFHHVNNQFVAPYEISTLFFALRYVFHTSK
jgi:hypothetical protein